ncbi:MAG: 4-(cytidine 5'-diphospho)-2-C-methyl-D-erythritol kinase [Acidobacteria bacterium]|nr:4-(cytidine 5'-diphospho)-2-C-methyl-D-erythritol kinase [Acidobacteriota bacterium]
MRELQIRIQSFAKINLSLAVLGRRPDGYHNIQTIFQSISLYDELEFRISDRLELRCENLPGVPQKDNLIWKAAKMLADAVPARRGASILLKKKIPSGAGLGGGSSNAAATLLGLCRLWRIRRSEIDLEPMAAELGSDVPFFLSGGTALGSGRGEKIHPLPDPQTLHLVVIFPGVQVSTVEAYQSLNLGLTSATEDNKIYRFCGQLKENKSFLAEIFNDFEASILPAYPPILQAKDFLRQQGAAVALLSGSGSAVFGFFNDEESALAASRAKARETWRVFPARTLSRTEYFQSMFG